MADIAHTDIGIERRALSPAAGGSVGDFVALMKPRVMSLVIFTALTGLVLARAPCIRRWPSLRFYALPSARVRRAP